MKGGVDGSMSFLSVAEVFAIIVNQIKPKSVMCLVF